MTRPVEIPETRYARSGDVSVAALAGPSEVLVSAKVRDLVAGSGLEFVDRGLQALEGLPEERRLYAVASWSRLARRPTEPDQLTTRRASRAA